LDIFTAISGGDGHRDTESLPSWVVDWSRDTVVISLLHTERLFKAAGNSKTRPRYRAKSRLCLSSYVVDLVVQVSRPFPCPTLLKSRPFARLLAQLWQMHTNELGDLEMEEVAQARRRKEYPMGGSALDAYWQTLCAGSLPGKWEEAGKAFYAWDRSRFLYRLISPFRFLPLLHLILMHLMWSIRFSMEFVFYVPQGKMVAQARKNWLVNRHTGVEHTGRSSFLNLILLVNY
jgi:hypothetical protein